MAAIGGSEQLRQPPAPVEPNFRRNVVANYAGRLWSIAAVYLFVPLYIKLLGPEAYGVIAFHSVLLGVLFIADAGLSAAFAREVTRSSDRRDLRVLLASLERVYALICISVAAVVVACSGWIARSWFQPSAEVPIGTLLLSVALMGVAAPIQVAMSLYHGALMGAERHSTANAFQVGFSLVRSGMVILPLYFIPDLRLYFAWQTLSGILFIACMRSSVWKLLHGRSSERFDARAIRRVWGFSSGMLGIAVISALNTQMDKLVVSKLLPLEEFARYAIASLIAQAPSIVTLPIAISVLPRLTKWAEHGDTANLIHAYERYSFAIASLACAVGASISLFPNDLILLWTRSPTMAAGSALVPIALTLGGVLLALQFMPYHLSLAHGHSATSLRLGVVSLVLTLPALIVLTQRLGAIGTAAPWLLMNACAFAFLGWRLTRMFLPIRTGLWFAKTALVPASICLALAVAASAADAWLALNGIGRACLFIGSLITMLAACAHAYRLFYAHSHTDT